MSSPGQTQLESEEAYRLLFDAMPLPVLVSDAETLKFLAVNEAALRLYGYSRDEFLAMQRQALWPPGVDVDARIRAIRGDPDDPQVFARQHITKGGAVLEVEVTARVIRFAGRRARMGVVQDITGRKLLERQFLQAQKMEAIGQLAGGVAHDFNNLLTVVKSYGSMLLEDMPTDDRGRESVQEIVEAADRAAALTRQLLAFSRRQLFDARALDLNVVIGDLGKMLRRLVPETIQIEVAASTGLGTVHADAGQIEQVILNLVVNARDAMPNGGKLTISTSNVTITAPAADGEPSPGSWVCVTVADTGSGMDEQTRARIFEPFFTTKARGHGTGLGLSTAYGIVQQSGGFVRVESRVGAGTTFDILLPRIAAEADGRARNAAPARAAGGSERVLLVEDEDSVRRVVTRVLKGLGYEVVEARDGLEALTIATRLPAPPDLVVTDIVMPKISGRELVDSLRELWPSLRVLFMSGYADETVGESGPLAAGAVFLAKPFLPDQLAGRVREALAVTMPAKPGDPG